MKTEPNSRQTFNGYPDVPPGVNVFEWILEEARRLQDLAKAEKPLQVPPRHLGRKL